MLTRNVTRTGGWIAVAAVTATVPVVLGIPHRIARLHTSALFATGIISRAWGGVRNRPAG